MMSGLIFAGIDPVKAIKYQIMVTFMLLSTASLSTYRRLSDLPEVLQRPPSAGGDAAEKAPVNDPGLRRSRLTRAT